MSSLPMAYRVGARVKKVRPSGLAGEGVPVGTEGRITAIGSRQCTVCGNIYRKSSGEFSVSYGLANDQCGCDDFGGSTAWCEVIQPEGYKVVSWEECLWSPQSGFQSQSDDCSVAPSVEVN